MIKKFALCLAFTFILACQTQAPSDKGKTDPPTDSDQAQQPAQQIKACSKDLKVCENGRTVGRDPNNNCEFMTCLQVPKPIPKDTVMCTQDVKQCPDGSFVGRDSSNNCAFPACPGGKEDLDDGR